MDQQKHYLDKTSSIHVIPASMRFLLQKKMSENMRKTMVETLVENLSGELEIEPDNICIIINTLAPGELFVSGNFIGISERNIDYCPGSYPALKKCSIP